MYDVQARDVLCEVLKIIILCVYVYYVYDRFACTVLSNITLFLSGICIYRPSLRIITEVFLLKVHTVHIII